MVMVGIELCPSAVLLACIVVCAPIVQGRSLRRHHHSVRLDVSMDRDGEQVPRDLPSRLEDDSSGIGTKLGFHHHLGHATDPWDHYLEYENESAAVDNESSSPHRYRHGYDVPFSRNDPYNYDELLSLRGRRRENPRRRYDEDSPDLRALASSTASRRKRHNKHGSTVNYRRITEQDRKDVLSSSRQELELHELGGLHESYELDVKDAQNSSICNYTVKSIPDDRGNRVPKDLEHVMCNHAGSSCHGSGESYCCIQTFRNIEVSYADGDKKTMKLYVGCVCALQMFNASLRLTESPLPIND